MSSIAFHQMMPDGTENRAHLSGAERMHGAVLCQELAANVLRLHAPWPDQLEKVRERINPDHSYLHRPEDIGDFNRWARNCATALLAANSARIRYDDPDEGAVWVSGFILSLNTALAAGSDPVRLLARLHGQCELHCYAEEGDRAWLARIIREGRVSQVLRRGEGWEEVAGLLEDCSHRPGPVVCSYSVSEGFPNPNLAMNAGLWQPAQDEDDEGEAIWDEWAELSPMEQWELGLPAARGQNEGLAPGKSWLRLDPAHWSDYRFVPAVSAWDIAEQMFAPARLRESD